MSGAPPTGSTRMTRAPSWRRARPADGTAIKLPTSTTRRPASLAGLAISPPFHDHGGFRVLLTPKVSAIMEPDQRNAGMGGGAAIASHRSPRARRPGGASPAGLAEDIAAGSRRWPVGWPAGVAAALARWPVTDQRGRRWRSRAVGRSGGQWGSPLLRPDGRSEQPAGVAAAPAGWPAGWPARAAAGSGRMAGRVASEGRRWLRAGGRVSDQRGRRRSE